MKQMRITIAAAPVVIIALVAVSTVTLRADVRADQKTRVQFAGMLGRMVNLFGGKGAREGVTSIVAVKGDRKATMNDSSGQIIDLNEEKVYDLDLKKKNYKVTTFAELRRRMEEAQKKAEEAAKKEQGKEAPAPKADANEKQMEIDFDVKNTGEKKAINGFNTSQAIMTVTVREKGKTVEEAGGIVMTSDMWLTPSVPAMKEIGEFDLRYARKLYGGMLSGVSAEDMATAMAMYPQMKQAITRMSAEAGKIQGTPIMTTVTVDAVKSADQVAQETKQPEAESKPTLGGGVGGLIGGFGRKIAKKPSSDEGPKARANIMTTTTEVLKVVTDVSPNDVAVPAGFKENK